MCFVYANTHFCVGNVFSDTFSIFCREGFGTAVKGYFLTPLLRSQRWGFIGANDGVYFILRGSSDQISKNRTIRFIALRDYYYRKDIATKCHCSTRTRSKVNGDGGMFNSSPDN